jgi:3D (Asp-Asp-Asp) domain-containing protein
MRAIMRHLIAWVIVPLMILGISFTVARCAPPSVALETTINPPRPLSVAATPSVETISASLEATASPRKPTPVAKPEPSPKPTPAPAPTPTTSDPTLPAPAATGGARTVTATGYCSCAACCGKSDGITASGARAAWGTIAAPKTYAFGSRFTISGLSGTFTVQDRGGAISGNRIDIWFPSHAEALRWGRRTVTLTPVN